MISHFVPELTIGEIVSTKELLDGIDPSSKGQYAEIFVGDHGAALYAVWKMSDDERSPDLEASVKEIVRRVNEHDKIIAKIHWMVESCDCSKLTDDFVRKHFEGCV